MSLFAERLVERRKKFDMTQKALAEKIDVGPTTVTNLERGHGKPSVPLLERLAHVLDTRPDYLLGWSNAAKPKVVPKRSAFLNG